MKLTVNGKTTEIESATTIAEFLRSKGLPEAGVVVEHNSRWLRREEWAGITLGENDRLEIVRMVAGGSGEDR